MTRGAASAQHLTKGRNRDCLVGRETRDICGMISLGYRSAISPAADQRKYPTRYSFGLLIRRSQVRILQGALV